jgi:hypothetical protein
VDGKGIIIVVGTKGGEDVLVIGGNGYCIAFNIHTVRVRGAVIIIHRYIKVRKSKLQTLLSCRSVAEFEKYGVLSLLRYLTNTSSSLNERQYIPCSLSHAT